MGEVTAESVQSSGSTAEQVRERVGDGAQQVQEQASAVKLRAGERLREQIDTRSTETGEQMASTASALRETAQQLRGDQHEPQARVLEQIAERAERFGRYLTETDGDRLLRDVERFARGRPWLVAGGGAIVGFLAARFTKASSSRRYQGDGGGDDRAAATGMPATAALPAGAVVSGRGGADGGNF
jgi:ElaB/YqjD/DUF883 family membrane-anchored ribosome-binding protein